MEAVCKEFGKEELEKLFSPRMVRLQSSDGEIFEVGENVVRLSKTVEKMRGEIALKSENDIIRLPRVKGDILKKVIDWASHHKFDPPLMSEEERLQMEYYEQRMHNTEDIEPWDRKFLRSNQETLFALMDAADYLDIEGLSDVVYKTVANMIKNRTPEALRIIFSIKNDLTKEDVALIKKQNAWFRD